MASSAIDSLSRERLDRSDQPSCDFFPASPQPAPPPVTTSSAQTTRTRSSPSPSSSSRCESAASSLAVDHAALPPVTPFPSSPTIPPQSSRRPADQLRPPILSVTSTSSSCLSVPSSSGVYLPSSAQSTSAPSSSTQSSSAQHTPVSSSSPRRRSSASSQTRKPMPALSQSLEDLLAFEVVLRPLSQTLPASHQASLLSPEPPPLSTHLSLPPATNSTAAASAAGSPLMTALDLGQRPAPTATSAALAASTGLLHSAMPSAPAPNSASPSSANRRNHHHTISTPYLRPRSSANTPPPPALARTPSSTGDTPTAITVPSPTVYPDSRPVSPTASFCSNASSNRRPRSPTSPGFHTSSPPKKKRGFLSLFKKHSSKSSRSSAASGSQSVSGSTGGIMTPSRTGSMVSVVSSSSRALTPSGGASTSRSATGGDVELQLRRPGSLYERGADARRTAASSPTPFAHSSGNEGVEADEKERDNEPINDLRPMPMQADTASVSSSALRPAIPLCFASIADGGESLCGLPASWDLGAELEAVERSARRRRGISETESIRMKERDGTLLRRETRAERKERKKREDEAFNADARPTAKEIFEASLYSVRDGHGEYHKFGDLIKDQWTVVVFIRHWYCPLCQDFMYSIVREVDPVAVEEAGVKLIIIGNGDPKVIHSYQGKIFHCPFPVYSDPTLELYRALGMTRQTNDGGPEEEKGDYVQHGTLSGTLHVIKNVGVMGRKGVTLNPGSITQLGGEFVFGPGLACTYSHRMSTTRSHASIKIPLAHAGVVFDGKPRPAAKLSSVAVGRVHAGRRTGATPLSIELAPGEVQSWRLERDLELERMRIWREPRRRGRSGASGKKRDTILEDREEKEAQEEEAEGWARAGAEQNALREKEKAEEQANAGEGRHHCVHGTCS